MCERLNRPAHLMRMGVLDTHHTQTTALCDMMSSRDIYIHLFSSVQGHSGLLALCTDWQEPVVTVQMLAWLKLFQPQSSSSPSHLHLLLLSIIFPFLSGRNILQLSFPVVLSVIYSLLPIISQHAISSCCCGSVEIKGGVQNPPCAMSQQHIPTSQRA